MAGLATARARGKQGGREKMGNNHPKVSMAKKMHLDHAMRIQDICKTLQISRASFYRYIML
ncbi:helix-turn-helix domain-containing protein [Candidatus Amoebophilus asiaticus]|uniref:helix-turn-helix domain-containing protein n=1 Tax=Candidatus Amoebophilus asiaticus TaxID=281120 RepID=UPI0001713B95|nr:helix-turn-helix domain-containing protein [Candidatus Amoebophilus asiaticus]